MWLRPVNFLPYITTPVAIGLIFSFLFDWSTGIVNKILMGLGLIDKGMNWLGDPKTGILCSSLYDHLEEYRLLYGNIPCRNHVHFGGCV